jgi:hypothetical protein
MIMVLNKSWGGFALPREFCGEYNFDRYDEIARDDPRLVEFVQSHGGLYEGDGVRLRLVEIPDTMTDWEKNDYDGIETITYVVDGKIYHA